jgi:GNAT superfamily N-acetyltransferase
VLEVNCNPDISPDAGYPAALSAGGVKFSDFVRYMVLNALARAGIQGHADRRTGSPTLSGDLVVSRSNNADRERLIKYLRECGFFRPGEVDIAIEVLDESLAGSDDCTYESRTAYLNGRPAGWVCFGPTPCTAGTYDVYWMVVDPELKGRGIGTALMDRVEREIAERGGRLIVLETSGRPQYHLTRQMYIGRGYAEEARVRDFYGPCDDQVLYTKRL